jgi:hypothetical protein
LRILLKCRLVLFQIMTYWHWTPYQVNQNFQSIYYLFINNKGTHILVLFIFQKSVLVKFIVSSTRLIILYEGKYLVELKASFLNTLYYWTAAFDYIIFLTFMIFLIFFLF